MWHASVAHPDRKIAAMVARKSLKGLGSEKLGEWSEQGPVAFHLRRRVTALEEEMVGSVVDFRGTDEGQEIFGRFLNEMQSHPKYSQIVQMALAELNSVQSPIIVI